MLRSARARLRPVGPPVMLSLHDLRAPAVVLDWHEAVAVAASLASLLIDARADACPSPSDVVLLPSGDLRVAGPGTLAGPPAAAVAGILASWLESVPCPAELRQLADRSAADDRVGGAAQDALAALLAALAFYERPGREALLASLADRAAAAVDQARRVEALDALTARTRVAAGGAVPSSWPVAVPPAALPIQAPAGAVESQPAVWDGPGSALPASDAPWRLAAPAAAAVLVFLGMAYLAASWLGPRDARPARTAADVEDDLPMSGDDLPPGATAEPPPAAEPQERSPRVGPAPGAASAARAPAGQPSPEPGAAQGDATTADPSGRPVPTPVPGAVDVAIAEREGRVVASPIAPVRPGGRPASGGRVYTTGDPLVTPAVLIRPHLPDEPPPGVPEEQIGTLEFVVAESGAVERVHLISPANRYHERMLVAAAKTWQFRPAMREGRPVRFRIRIRVTL